MRILVLALDTFGDQVLRQPLLSGLLDDGHDVTVVVRPGFERVLPLVDPRLAAHPCPFEYATAPTLGVAQAFLDGLAPLEPDLVVSAQFDPVRYADWVLRRLPDVRAAGFEGGKEFRVSGASALEPELGLASARSLDVPVSCEASLPEAEKNARLLEALTGRALRARPRLTLPSGCLERGRERLARLGLVAGAYAVCCPAGTMNVRLKAWPPWRFAAVVSWMQRERGLPVLVMGHVSEVEIVDGVTRLAEEPCPVSFLGRDEDFELMTSLLALSRLYLGNDTGPMHLAAASGVPVVAIFGGGHWPRFLPMAETGAAHTQELDCFGCGWAECVFGDAPCVGHVEEDTVRESVARVLDGGRGFEVRAQPPVTEDDVRARPLQRFRAAAAEAARELDGILDPGPAARRPDDPDRRLADAVGRVRARLRKCDETVREMSERADRLDREREERETQAAGQAAWIREQGAQIVGLDAVARRAPLVTVVTPTLDAARWLEDCILSVRGQDYAKVEHIVVDGGSTDGTLEICGRYPHLVVCSAPDRGQAEALNRGFAMARGDVLAWLGAGDEYRPRAISIAVDTMLEGHDAVVGLCQLVDADGQRVGPHPGNPAGDLDHRALLRSRGAPLPEQAIFWRRRLWERAGPLRQLPDHDFWLRLVRITHLHRVGTDLATCRVHPPAGQPVHGEASGRKAGTPRRRSRLRIALFNSQAVRSGSERFTMRTAEGLLARGHDVRLYVRDAMPEEERPHYLRPFPDLPLLRRAESSFRYRTGLDDLFFPSTALLRFWPWLASADVWHFHNLHGHFLSLPALAAVSWTKPVLLSPLDDYLTTGRCADSLPIGRDRTRILRRMKNLSARASRFQLLLQTRYLEARHRDAMPWARIRRLRPGVNVHTYRPVPRPEALRAAGLPEDGRFVVGAVHTNLWDGRNGILGAVEGLRTLAARLPVRLRVLLAGHGGEPALALANDALDVRYVGFVRKEGDMSMVLSCCDVLISPSLAENLSFACLEAMSCGVPVVSYHSGGQGEAVRDGVNGLLVPPEIAALLSAVERLARDPALRGRLSQGARETAVRELDMDRYLDELVPCYEELAGLKLAAHPH